MGKGAKKPKYGFYLSLIGGLIILIWGILGIAGVTLGFGLGLISLMLEGILSLIWGILILIFAYLMYGGRKWGGIVIVILAILNVIVGFDLYFIGFILSFIGGLVGYAGK